MTGQEKKILIEKIKNELIKIYGNDNDDLTNTKGCFVNGRWLSVQSIFYDVCDIIDKFGE